MSITVEEQIDAARTRVWALISNPDGWADMISGIVDVEVLERPTEGLVGLKWTEKRVMFGKEATETMTVTAAESGRFYETTAHNHGMLYTTRMSLDDAQGGTLLRMSFTARATTLSARLLSPIARLFNGALRKALQQDLADIRRRAEHADA